MTVLPSCFSDSYPGSARAGYYLKPFHVHGHGQGHQRQRVHGHLISVSKEEKTPRTSSRHSASAAATMTAARVFELPYRAHWIPVQRTWSVTFTTHGHSRGNFNLFKLDASEIQR